MILGMSFESFTTLHVVFSLVGIATGVVVAFAMASGKHLPVMTALFLSTTLLTSATGFLFPVAELTPAQIFGYVSLAALALALAALYVFHLDGPWRWIYVVTAVLALYLNAFVGVVQAFQKQPPLQTLAPTQTEPPFIIAQAVTLLAALAIGFLALQRFRA